MEMTTNMIQALKLRYESAIAEATCNIAVYLKNPAGIGEHPDIVEAVDSQIMKIAEAQDKLHVIEEYYEEEADSE
jgi:hypothetical protein